MSSPSTGAPRYLFREPIGKGGMAQVHLGIMLSSAGERQVAIKRLLAKAGANAPDKSRLVAEARLVFQLTHANICQVIDLGENEDGTFVVMEYVAGLDLSTLVKRAQEANRPLAPALVVHIVREVARALDYAHRRTNERGEPLMLVHGDVTPRNVLISSEGEVKLADFGIARALGGLAPGNQLVAGTPGFVAPEATRSSAIDHRADIYSLGRTLAAALGAAADDDPNLAAIIARATADQPNERYLSAGELESVLAIDLSRRDPSFTPSKLADQVRAHASARTPTNPEVEKTLTSLTAGTLVALSSSIALPRPHTETASPPAPPRARRWPWLIAAISIAGVTLGGVIRWRRTETPAIPPRSSLSTPTPTPTPSPSPSPSPTPTPTPSPSPSAPAPHRAAKGFLTVNSTPWGVLYVDGKKVADETPVYRLALSEGSHRIAVFYPSRGTYSASQRVIISPGQTKVLGFHP